MKRLLTTCLTLLWILCPMPISAQDSQKKDANSSDPPGFSYEAPGGWELITDAGYKIFSGKFRAYLEGVLRDYKITDKAALKRIYRTLAVLDLQDGKSDAVLQRIRLIRDLESVPDLKLMPPVLFEVELIAGAQKQTGASGGEKYRQAFRRMFTESLNNLPSSFYLYHRIEKYKGIRDAFRWKYAEGEFEAMAVPMRENGNKLNFDMAEKLVHIMLYDRYFAPLANEIQEATETYLAAHEAPPKPNIWTDRRVILTNDQKLTPVVIAVWDTGVDPTVFPNQMFVNPKERANGKDNDGNGFASDLHGIGFDEKGKYTPAPLFPNVDSGLPYSHGTASASIAIDGNPAARLMNARSTWRDKSGEENTVEANEQWAHAFAGNVKAFVGYFKKHKVRVVHMGWHITHSGIKRSLAKYELIARQRESAAKGDSAKEKSFEERSAENEERALKLEIKADKIYAVIRKAVVEAIRSAPEILFVASAGDLYDNADLNRNMNASRFGEVLPGAIELPNVITIGAADTDGAQLTYTNVNDLDDAIDLYAQGVSVEAKIPGGKKQIFDGTPAAASQAANLAAKLFALNPKLTVAQVVNLIEKGADAGLPDRLNLINPKRSVELLPSGKTR